VLNYIFAYADNLGKGPKGVKGGGGIPPEAGA